MNLLAAEPCAAILKALADETRLAVVRQLMSGPKYVAELNQPLELEQSLLSHHLKALREAGIVESQREGKSVLYRLTPGMEGRRAGSVLNLGCCRIVFD